jgi:ribonuclease R
MAVQSSERERAAMQVEREVVSFYSALLVQDRIGEVFRATVAAVTDFGFFVQIDDVWVEGLVKAESVGFGARYDERRLALTYPDGKSICFRSMLTEAIVTRHGRPTFTTSPLPKFTRYVD